MNLQRQHDINEAVQAYIDGGYKLLGLTVHAIVEARGLVRWEARVFAQQIRGSVYETLGVHIQRDARYR